MSRQKRRSGRQQPPAASRKPRTYSILPERFEDGRWLALLDGLKAVGFDVHHNQSWRASGLPADTDVGNRDVLITWTRHHSRIEGFCEWFEARGGKVIVAEEAHLRFLPNGPYPTDQYFSLCLHDHQLFWRSYGAERWRSWNVDMKPWRAAGKRILVREQRGIGSTRMASPPDWHAKIAARLHRFTTAEVEIVTHPKNLKKAGRPVPSDELALHDAWCVVTWASHFGTIALLQGIPVIQLAPHFMVGPCCGHRLDQVTNPPMPLHRETTFGNFAWAQWAMSEIRSGEAFARLLGI